MRRLAYYSGTRFKSDEAIDDSDMAPPYSTDLRWRIVWLVLTLQVSSDVVSRLLNVSARTVTRYIDLFQRTGQVM